MSNFLIGIIIGLALGVFIASWIDEGGGEPK